MFTYRTIFWRNVYCSVYFGTLEIVLMRKKIWPYFTKDLMIVIVSVIPPNSLAESGWSVEGVTTETETVEGDLSIIQCSSLHLTSFAVLVDVRGVQVRTHLWFYVM